MLRGWNARRQGTLEGLRSGQALNSVDLEVAEGEVAALLGRNGAGKTTLVSIVAGLLSADSGSVEIGGIDAFADPRRAQANLGLAPQETGVYPTLSCRDNLRLFTGLAGMGRSESRAPPPTISPNCSALPTCLIVGQRSCPAANADVCTRPLHWSASPSLVLLDEPTVGADVQTRSQLLACRAGSGSKRRGSGLFHSLLSRGC